MAAFQMSASYDGESISLYHTINGHAVVHCGDFGDDIRYFTEFVDAVSYFDDLVISLEIRKAMEEND